MRCLNCAKFSFRFICKSCTSHLQRGSFLKRQIDDLVIYSAFYYSEVKPLLYSKHHIYGAFVYKSLGKIAKSKINLDLLEGKFNLIPIDDHVENGYSHTAIIAKELSSSKLKPLYNSLKATNKVHYSGKPLSFRKANKRGFKVLKKPNLPIILVDDIVTTGETLLQAKKALQKEGLEVICAIVLADAGT